MSLLDDLPRMVRLYERGKITADEFVGKLTQCFAYDEKLDLKDAADVAAAIPPLLHAPVRERIDATLAPGYNRRFVCSGRHTEAEQRAADLRITARERAWAAALDPFFP